jgi:hypothetical protein
MPSPSSSPPTPISNGPTTQLSQLSEVDIYTCRNQGVTQALTIMMIFYIVTLFTVILRILYVRRQQKSDIWKSISKVFYAILVHNISRVVQFIVYMTMPSAYSGKFLFNDYARIISTELGFVLYMTIITYITSMWYNIYQLYHQLILKIQDQDAAQPVDMNKVFWFINGVVYAGFIAGFLLLCLVQD